MKRFLIFLLAFTSCGRIEEPKDLGADPFTFVEPSLDIMESDFLEEDFSDDVAPQETDYPKYPCYWLIKQYIDEHPDIFAENCLNVICKRGALCYDGICYKLDCLE
jgi:hypothetical protein